MRELDYKESWAPKNWCFWTVVLEKTLKCPLDCKEIQSVNPKRNQPWIFIGRTGAEAEAPIIWPLDAKSRFIGKDPDVEKDWRQEEKGTTGWDGWMASPTRCKLWEMVKDREAWCATCSSWGCKESDMTEQLNNNNKGEEKASLWFMPEECAQHTCKNEKNWAERAGERRSVDYIKENSS